MVRTDAPVPVSRRVSVVPSPSPSPSPSAAGGASGRSRGALATTCPVPVAVSAAAAAVPVATPASTVPSPAAAAEPGLRRDQRAARYVAIPGMAPAAASSVDRRKVVPACRRLYSARSCEPMEP
jgi:hypothetical protein